MIPPSAAEQKDLRALFTQRQTPLDILLLKQQEFKYSRFGLYQLPHYIMHITIRVSLFNTYYNGLASETLLNVFTSKPGSSLSDSLHSCQVQRFIEAALMSLHLDDLNKKALKHKD